ncbi:MAG TPA: XrtA system polysaccharide deacetylase [Chitinophagaceae bacterium]
MKCAFTVDVEDWFCSHNLQQSISYNDWNNLEGRVERNTHRLLKLLDWHHVKATFFVLGWVAEKYPSLVKDIASMGHEIGSHGYRHQLVTKMTRKTFSEDLILSIDSIRDSCGIMPVGYRAPAFSITEKTLWALQILKEAGFKYDSSIYPISMHPDYGFPGASLVPYEPVPGLTEIPMSCSEKWGMRIPCSGGAYLRFFPYTVFTKLVKEVLNAGRPYIFYIHPWELDKDSPRVPLPFLKSARHYANLHTTEQKLNRLLQEFEFTSINKIFENVSYDDQPVSAR